MEGSLTCSCAVAVAVAVTVVVDFPETAVFKNGSATELVVNTGVVAVAVAVAVAVTDLWYWSL